MDQYAVVATLAQVAGDPAVQATERAEQRVAAGSIVAVGESRVEPPAKWGERVGKHLAGERRQVEGAVVRDRQPVQVHVVMCGEVAAELERRSLGPARWQILIDGDSHRR